MPPSPRERGATAGGAAASASPPPPVSIPARTSAPTATPAPSSPPRTRWPPVFTSCGTGGATASTTIPRSVSTRASTPFRPWSSRRSSRAWRLGTRPGAGPPPATTSSSRTCPASSGLAPCRATNTSGISTSSGCRGGTRCWRASRRGGSARASTIPFPSIFTAPCAIWDIGKGTSLSRKARPGRSSPCPCTRTSPASSRSAWWQCCGERWDDSPGALHGLRRGRRLLPGPAPGGRIRGGGRLLPCLGPHRARGCHVCLLLRPARGGPLLRGDRSQCSGFSGGGAASRTGPAPLDPVRPHPQATAPRHPPPWRLESPLWSAAAPSRLLPHQVGDPRGRARRRHVPRHRSRHRLRGRPRPDDRAAGAGRDRREPVSEAPRGGETAVRGTDPPDEDALAAVAPAPGPGGGFVPPQAAALRRQNRLEPRRRLDRALHPRLHLPPVSRREDVTRRPGGGDPGTGRDRSRPAGPPPRRAGAQAGRSRGGAVRIGLPERPPGPVSGGGAARGRGPRSYVMRDLPKDEILALVDAAPATAPERRVRYRGLSLCVVMASWNEAGKVGPGVRAVPRDVVDTVCVVDNGSGDGTGEEAREAGAVVIPHPRNLGAG